MPEGHERFESAKGASHPTGAQAIDFGDGSRSGDAEASAGLPLPSGGMRFFALTLSILTQILIGVIVALGGNPIVGAIAALTVTFCSLLLVIAEASCGNSHRPSYATDPQTGSSSGYRSRKSLNIVAWLSTAILMIVIVSISVWILSGDILIGVLPSSALIGIITAYSLFRQSGPARGSGDAELIGARISRAETASDRGQEVR